ELGDRGVDVVAHEVQLVAARAVGRMHGDLGRWRGEDEPAVPGIHVAEAEEILQEAPVGLGIAAVDDGVESVDHGRTIGSAGRWADHEGGMSGWTPSKARSSSAATWTSRGTAATST